MAIWNKILANLKQHKKVVLLLVVESKGSSPGRQGFKMMLTEDGKRFGSIGGGTTEHKLVSRAEKMLEENILDPEFHEQVHRTDEEMHKSGMICSGENTVLLYPLYDIHTDNIQEISGNATLGYETTITLGLDKFTSRNGAAIPGQFEFSEDLYQEVIGYKHIVFIVGGGHVSLALSRQMKMLGFYVKVYDNRKDLDTLTSNSFANEKHIIDYKDLDDYIPKRKDVYAVIASFSHQNDKFVLSKLLGKDLDYLGMMGSKNKVMTIFDILEKEGYSREELNKVSAPIGVAIKSETPEEIAVSIAAEIVDVKNSN